MANYSSQPPEFRPQKKKHTGLIVVLVIVCLAVLGTAAYFMLPGTSSQSGGKTEVVTKSEPRYNGRIEVSDVSDVVAIAKPTVVEILTETTTAPTFFGQGGIQQGAGSGVIMTADGYIITNNHVIDGAQTITVTTADGRTFDATLIGRDPQTDLAVIKVDATDLPHAEFGDSDALEVGDAAIAIGNPLGSLGGSVTKGIISALDREITIEDTTMTLLQTDAAINPGNSGGGLFDANGYLIGIVNAKQSASGIEGLGFAIPVNGAKIVLEELIQNGKVTSRPVLNVSLTEYDGNSQYGYQMEPGVYIVQVVDGGTAARAGLEVGDRIIAIDGTNIESVSQVKKILNGHKIGDTVSMQIDRDGHEQTIDVTLYGSD